MLHRTTLDSVTNLVRSDNTARRLRGGDLDQICSNRFSPSSTLWIIWPDLCQAIAATNGEKRCTRELSANGALKQIKGVGTLIALTFLLTLEDPHRFRKSREVGCYLGLQPGRRNSGQSEPQMHISKEGDPYMRTLLVQGAQHILGSFGVDCDLRRWITAFLMRVHSLCDHAVELQTSADRATAIAAVVGPAFPRCLGCTLPVKALTSCSSVQATAHPPALQPLGIALALCQSVHNASPLAPSRLLTRIDSLMRISSSRHFIWFCSRTRSRVSCTFNSARSATRKL
jgi:hypothetical protein